MKVISGLIINRIKQSPYFLPLTEDQERDYKRIIEETVTEELAKRFNATNLIHYSEWIDSEIAKGNNTKALEIYFELQFKYSTAIFSGMADEIETCYNLMRNINEKIKLALSIEDRSY